MTKAAQAFGKQLNNFWRSPDTAEYVEALEQTLKLNVWVAKRGGRKGEAGTWCHPKLAVFFARWLDVRFAVWCDLMIDNILHGHIQTTVAVPTEEALAVDSVVASLRARVEALQENVKRLQEEGFKGGVPDGWSTAWCFLEDKGVSVKFIKNYAADLGSYAVALHRELTGNPMNSCYWDANDYQARDKRVSTPPRQACS